MSKLKQTIEEKKPGAYDTLWKADPSPNKYAVPWLCKLYLSNKLPLEDLPKATTYLKDFHKYRRNLTKKKLEEYNSLPELYAAIKKYMPEQEVAADTEEKKPAPMC